MAIMKSWTEYSTARTNYAEDNDCSVLALSVASGMPYDAVHALFAKHGRQNRCGTQLVTTKKVMAEIEAKEIDLKTVSEKSPDQYFPTLKQFLWDHKKGKYVVHRRGHAFAVIDGVVHDWYTGTGARSRVTYAVKISD